MNEFAEDQDEVYKSKDDGEFTEVQSLDMPAIPIPPEIRSFLIHLLEDADTLPRSHRLDIGPFSFDFSLEDIRPGTRENMIQELYESFNKFYIAHLLQEMPVEYLEQFADLMDHLVDAEDPDEIEQYIAAFNTFLEQNIPSYQEVRAEIFFEFRHLYLDGVAKSRSRQDIEQ